MGIDEGPVSRLRTDEVTQCCVAQHRLSDVLVRQQRHEAPRVEPADEVSDVGCILRLLGEVHLVDAAPAWVDVVEVQTATALRGFDQDHEGLLQVLEHFFVVLVDVFKISVGELDAADLGVLLPELLQLVHRLCKHVVNALLLLGFGGV